MENAKTLFNEWIEFPLEDKDLVKELDSIKDDNDAIFDRFYTGVIIADGRKSLGLGLALCKSIIKAHNGEILVADNEPNGTKITFTLPIEEVEFHE